MKTISTNITHEIEVKNSRFITKIFSINDSNINNYLELVKREYPKATHYCYAYIYNEEKRFSDDGEPTGTAGAPILNVLEKEQLNNVLIIVVRYFGGIKLGAGGLIRAYTKSVTETLKEVEYTELIEGYKIEITFPYSEEKQINYLLKTTEIINKNYDEDITYTALVPKEKIDKLHNYNYKVLETLYIEKKNST